MQTVTVALLALLPLAATANFTGSCEREYGHLLEAPATISWLDHSGLQLVRMNSNSLNAVYFAKDSAGNTVAVFKPIRMGQGGWKDIRNWNMKWDLPGLRRSYEKGSSTKRDQAAFIVSEALGFHVAPAAGVGTTSQGEKGTLQAFLTGFQEGATADPALLAKVPPGEAQKMILLDAILGTQDRNARNWMVNSSGRLNVIDSEFSLPLVPKMRWGLHSDPRLFFPQALGKVDSSLAKSVQAYKPEDLIRHLTPLDLPAPALHYATVRLVALQSMLAEGKPLEEIYDSFSHVSLLTNDRATGIALIFAAGAGASEEVIRREYFTRAPANPSSNDR